MRAHRQMPLKVSTRGRIPSFMVMDVMRAANEREVARQAVYHLEVGQPGTGAPDGVVRVAHEALSGQRLGYTEALGIPELRHAIAGHYRDYYGTEVDPARVGGTTGYRPEKRRVGEEGGRTCRYRGGADN